MAGAIGRAIPAVPHSTTAGEALSHSLFMPETLALRTGPVEPRLVEPPFLSARSFINAFYSQCQPKDLCLNPQYGQCGGFDHHQPPRPWTKANHHSTCCPDSFDCTYSNPYYSQCDFNATNSTCATKYAQCGGEGWTGPTCCIPGFECQKDPKNPKYYSGCMVCPNTTSDSGAHLLAASSPLAHMC